MSAQPEGTASATGRGRSRRRARATSEELVQAAIRVISRDGVAAATTRKIAEEAGVPLGTVHYWFTDKSELLEDVIRAVLGRLEAAVESSRRDGDDEAQGAREALHAAWGVVADDDPGAQLGLYELTTYAVRNPALQELPRAQYRAYREMAARALAPFLADVDPERAATAAELVAVTFDGLGLAWLADPEGTHPRQVLDLLADLLVDLLAGPRKA